MKFKFPLFALAIVFVMVAACKKDDPDGDVQTGDERRFELYFTYYNPTGDDPVAIPNSAFQSSPEVIIDSSAVVSTNIGQNQNEVTFNNVSLLTPATDGRTQVNYEIEDLFVEFYQNGEWYKDEEFEFGHSNVEDLDFVIVMDASKSLEGEFPQIQQFVKNFLAKLHTDISDVSVGIVDFATEVHWQQIQSNQAVTTAFIDGVELGQFTALYQAMDKGIDLFQGSTAKSKALLTFTDGIDNQTPPSINPETLLNRLTSPNNDRIASFMVGYSDSYVDPVTLENLAVNGGIATFPQTLQDLDEAFKDFSKTISSTHSLIYRPNGQIISSANPRNLRYVIKAKAK